MVLKKVFLLILVSLFTFCWLNAQGLQSKKEESGLLGFGFSKNSINNSGIFYLIVNNGVLKIEKEKFKIEERKGVNKEKVIFDIYNPNGSINKFLKKKGLSFINIKIGTLFLERVENSIDKFRGFINFKVLPSNTKLPSKLYVVLKKKENN